MGKKGGRKQAQKKQQALSEVATSPMTVTSLSTTLPEVPTNLKIHTDSIKTSTLLTLASTATLNPDQVDVSETPTTTSSPASMNLADEITRLKSEMRDAKEASQSVEARLGETLRTLEKGHEERMKAKDEQHVAEMTALEAKLCQKVSNVEEELVAVKAEYERKLEAAMNQNQELCKKVAAITAELQDTTKELHDIKRAREEEMASHGAMIVERERRIGGLKEALEKKEVERVRAVEVMMKQIDHVKGIRAREAQVSAVQGRMIVERDARILELTNQNDGLKDVRGTAKIVVDTNVDSTKGASSPLQKDIVEDITVNSTMEAAIPLQKESVDDSATAVFRSALLTDADTIQPVVSTVKAPSGSETGVSATGVKEGRRERSRPFAKFGAALKALFVVKKKV